jgi:hypothetical protein
MHKECHYCKNIHHARCYRFYIKNSQKKFWVCTYCLESKGGTRNVQSELDKLPLPQIETNFFKSTPLTQRNFKNKPKGNSWTPNEEFAKFKLNPTFAENGL